MLEIFAGWKLWQIILTAVFGTVWLVFIILDCRRKSKLRKLYKEREEVFEWWVSDKQKKIQIDENQLTFESEVLKNA